MLAPRVSLNLTDITKINPLTADIQYIILVIRSCLLAATIAPDIEVEFRKTSSVFTKEEKIATNFLHFVLRFKPIVRNRVGMVEFR